MHILKPRLSEKAFLLSQSTNTFAIDVPSEINKHEVANAIAKQFDVTVVSVRIVNRKGKVKRVMNLTGKRSSNHKGVKSDVKKAYVTLAKGSHLPFFQAEEAEVEELAKGAAKVKGAATKNADKSSEKKTSVVKKLTGKVKKEDK